MTTPNSFAACRSEVMVTVRGRVTQQLKLNVAFGNDVSGTIKIQCTGRNITLLISNYSRRMDEVAAYGTQVIRPFMSGITNKQPNYAHSANVKILWTASTRGKLDPNILYQAIGRHHAALGERIYRGRFRLSSFRRRIMDIVISERPAGQAPAAPAHPAESSTARPAKRTRSAEPQALLDQDEEQEELGSQPEHPMEETQDDAFVGGGGPQKPKSKKKSKAKF
ncbi:uncharacterized protein EV154DRAFT_486167 [Mucor mucedo]|uniref:uncharacterized protein n=1 Tax=Mucor mucedo TaxID=29922 RepID=UPI002220CEC0|nr:uncharacterized protein EV154DRAFT_486167 [Mucor mucedo]KAI7878533.1 hypothetical protein EV154DRAFT_486167 [Mucor mucedo]